MTLKEKIDEIVNSEKPLDSCPFCNFKSLYSRKQIWQHIKRKHPDKYKSRSERILALVNEYTDKSKRDIMDFLLGAVLGDRSIMADHILNFVKDKFNESEVIKMCEEKKIVLQEGKVNKGGRNLDPTESRPDEAPKGQGTDRFAMLGNDLRFIKEEAVNRNMLEHTIIYTANKIGEMEALQEATKSELTKLALSNDLANMRMVKHVLEVYTTVFINE